MNLRQFFERENSRPTMFIPYLKDCDDFRKEDEVRQICRQCAQQLAAQLFIWRKQFPSSNTVKSWDAQQMRFTGLDISLFQQFIHAHYSVRTRDGREWLLDKSIAARIWAECVSEDSPLPEANWDIEARKRGEK